MLYTSAEANKLLKQLTEEKDLLRNYESKNSRFVAATVEDINEVRPAYDYEKISANISEYDRKIRKVKHALNVFNSQTIVEGFDMTIDEMLVYLPQLSQKLNRLSILASQPAKVRKESYGSKFIEYDYANYDTTKVNEDYKKLFALKSEAQNALDKVNNAVSFEIEL